MFRLFLTRTYMKNRHFLKLYFSFLIFYFSFLSCASVSESESRLYGQVFKEEKGMFRGISLGDKLAKVQEKLPPLYTDILGAVYEIPLSNTEKMQVRYYIDNLQTNRETNRIATIQASIRVEDEIETTRLYTEIQQTLTQKYGLPTGNYGALKWENTAYGMEVSLQISPNRKQIELAFVSSSFPADSRK